MWWSNDWLSAGIFFKKYVWIQPSRIVNHTNDQQQKQRMNVTKKMETLIVFRVFYISLMVSFSTVYRKLDAISTIFQKKTKKNWNAHTLNLYTKSHQILIRSIQIYFQKFWLFSRNWFTFNRFHSCFSFTFSARIL